MIPAYKFCIVVGNSHRFNEYINIKCSQFMIMKNDKLISFIIKFTSFIHNGLVVGEKVEKVEKVLKKSCSNPDYIGSKRILCKALLDYMAGHTVKQ